jgi:hypothetical protein
LAGDGAYRGDQPRTIGERHQEDQQPVVNGSRIPERGRAETRATMVSRPGGRVSGIHGREALRTCGKGEPVNLYGVHVVLAHNNRATEAVFDELTDAEAFAKRRSTDPEVFGAGIARYEVDTPGTRVAVTLYVDGTRQATADVSDDWRVFTTGPGYELN